MDSDPNRSEGSTRPESYTTTDLDLASFLACRGLQPTQIRPPLPHTYPNFATFVYDHVEGLQAALEEWSHDESLHVDLRQFLDHRRAFYREVRSLREGGR
jgi:hypothetical protein